MYKSDIMLTLCFTYEFEEILKIQSIFYFFFAISVGSFILQRHFYNSPRSKKVHFNLVNSFFSTSKIPAYIINTPARETAATPKTTFH